jgi:hypothetical protein
MVISNLKQNSGKSHRSSYTEVSMKKIYFPDTATILNPCWDAVFKLIFTRETPSSRGALGNLASAFVRRKTQVLAVSANEPPANGPQDRQIRFDIACKLDGGELADLEMTLYPKPFEPARLEYHLARLYTNQDIKGTEKTFDNLKRTYQISFFAEKNLYRGRDMVHHFTYYDKKHELSLGGRTKIITVELQKAFFFRYGPDVEQRQRINEIMAIEEGIAMAGEELLTVSGDERLQAWIAEKYELDRHSDLVYARQEGQTKGYKKAKAEDQKQIRQAQEQIRQARERIRQLEEENRRLRGE